MPRIRTMTVVRTACKRRANMENDPSISAAEWNSYISEVYGELYEEVARTGLRYFEYEEDYTTTSAAYIAEPSDMLAMVDSLEIQDSSGTYRRLQPIRAQERARYAGQTGDPYMFEFVDDRLYLFPSPGAGKTITLRYVAQSPDLSEYADGQSIDLVTAGGEAFLHWGVAAIAKHKDDRFVDYAEQQKERARLRLVDWAASKLANESSRPYVDDEADHFVRLPGDWSQP
jgi:hypothetical protein